MSDETNNSGSGLPTKMSLTIRIMVAAYVLYLAYGLFKDVGNYEGSQKYIYIAAAVFFAVFSCIILIFAVKAYATGAYVGGKLDNVTEEEPEMKKDILLAEEENETTSENIQQIVQNNDTI